VVANPIKKRMIGQSSPLDDNFFNPLEKTKPSDRHRGTISGRRRLSPLGLLTRKGPGLHFGHKNKKGSPMISLKGTPLKWERKRKIARGPLFIYSRDPSRYAKKKIE